jgi:hypothetical protein
LEDIKLALELKVGWEESEVVVICNEEGAKLGKDNTKV